MATVTLPMGYPLQTGHEFEYLVYQGRMVRLYTLPADPRNNSQVFERRFLSDLSKVRATLSAFGKKACKYGIGSTWSSILFQIIKADINSYWSNAVLAWDGFNEIDREAWRAVAPYTATFNDQGKMFFCLARVIHDALLEYAGFAYDSQEWGAGDSAAAFAWWDGQLYGVMKKPVNLEFRRGSNLAYADWNDVNNASAYLGVYVQSTSANVVATFYIEAASFFLYYVRKQIYDHLDIYINDVLYSSIDVGDVADSSVLFGEVWVNFGEKALKKVEIKSNGAVIGLDWLKV